MHFPSRYALMALAPLALSSIGCASPFNVARATQRTTPEQAQKRMLAMAQIYENRGEFEQAHRLYCQVLQSDPNQPYARQHATDLFVALREEKLPAGAEPSPPEPAVEPAPFVPDAETRLARIRSRRPRILTDAEVLARVPKPRPKPGEVPFDHELAAEVDREEEAIEADFQAEEIAVARQEFTERLAADEAAAKQALLVRIAAEEAAAKQVIAERVAAVELAAREAIEKQVQAEEEAIAARQAIADQFIAENAAAELASAQRASTQIAIAPAPITPAPVAPLAVAEPDDSEPAFAEDFLDDEDLSAVEPEVETQVSAAAVLPAETLIEQLDVETIEFGQRLPRVQSADSQTVVIEKPLAIVEPKTAPADVHWVPTAHSRMCADAPPELVPVLEQLGSADPEVRKSALEVLASIGDDGFSVAPAIRRCLNDQDPVVQVYAAWALWQTACADECLPKLQQLLRSEDENAVALACYVLGEIGAPAGEALEPIARLQNHASTHIRIHAAEAILKISDGNSGSVIVLANAITLASDAERVLISDALGAAKGLDRSAAIDTLIESLNDSNPTVRAAAALALGGFRDKAAKATPALVRASQAGDLETRIAAANALACIKR